MKWFGFLFVAFCVSNATAKEFVITATGDTNFIQTLLQHPKSQFQPDKTMKYGTWYTWADMTKYLTPDLLSGDLNFTNMETVITDDIYKLKHRPGPSYAFASHINSLRHITSIGFNLISLSNNHSYNFGMGGLSETRKSADLVQSEFPGMHHSGLFYEDEYPRPTVFVKNGVTVAFAAINGVGSVEPPPATETRPTMISIKNTKEYKKLIAEFAQIDADLKILSIHNGRERVVDIEKTQIEMFRYAVDEGQVDLILGHHPHAVRPVELYNGATIFYSLGNFMMVGAADINRKSTPLNYGVMAKIFLDIGRSQNQVTALEMIPFYKVHIQPRPMGPEQAAIRIRSLNKTTRNNLPQTGVLFDMGPTGTGVFCSELAKGTQASELCP